MGSRSDQGCDALDQGEGHQIKIRSMVDSPGDGKEPKGKQFQRNKCFEI